MNAHFFGAKRAYYATLRIARPLLAKYGLTPARLDLMSVLRKSFAHSTLQSALRKALGVAGATVSRMLTSLEQLGFVKCERSPYDRRQRVVSLTDEGLSRVQAVHDEVIDDDVVDFALDCALAAEEWYDESACLLAKDNAEMVFRRLRTAFGDRATLHYPWHPDD